jgi:pilus assembly protein CpaB
MNRTTRTMVVVAVSLVAATVASASVYRAVKRIPVREVEVAHEFVVMASRPLPIGARLRASDLKRVGWPSSSPLSGSFTRVEDVIGRGVVTTLAENEAITESKLAPREAGAGLAPAIPPGMRAISVKVNEVIGVAGFAVPGAHVDVVATVRGTDNNAASRVLVSNVPVLTAGTRYDQEGTTTRDGKPIPSTVVTLMATPSQAEKIALASAEGQITLMLRNPLDVDEPATAGVRLSSLMGGFANDPAPAVPQTSRPAPRAVPRAVVPTTVQAAAPVAEAAPSGLYIVEAIRAGKRTQETIQ